MLTFLFLNKTYSVTTHWNRLIETIPMMVTPLDLVKKWINYHDNCVENYFLTGALSLDPWILFTLTWCGNIFDTSFFEVLLFYLTCYKSSFTAIKFSFSRQNCYFNDVHIVHIAAIIYDKFQHLWNDSGECFDKYMIISLLDDDKWWW